MKSSLISLLVIVSLSCWSQVDSSEIKLEKYRNMYQKGLIDSSEYSRLKETVLFSKKPEQNPEQKQVKSLAELRSSYRGKLIAGPILMGIGVGFIVGGVAYAGYNIDPRQVRINRGLLLGTGVVCSVVGAVLLASGIATRVVYKNRKELTAGVLGSGNLGITIVI